MPLNFEDVTVQEVPSESTAVAKPKLDFSNVETSSVPQNSIETEIALQKKLPGSSAENISYATQLFPRSMKNRSLELNNVEVPWYKTLGAASADALSLPARGYGSLFGVPPAQYEQKNQSFLENVYRDPTLPVALLAGGPTIGLAKTGLGRFGVGGLASLAYTGMSDASRRAGNEEGASPVEYGLSALLGGTLASGGGKVSQMIQARRLRARLPEGTPIPEAIAANKKFITPTERGLNRALEGQQKEALASIRPASAERELSSMIGGKPGTHKLSVRTPAEAQASHLSSVSDKIKRSVYKMVQDDEQLASEAAGAVRELDGLSSAISDVLKSAGPIKSSTAEDMLVKELINSKNPLLKKALSKVYKDKADVFKFTTADQNIFNERLPITSNIASLAGSVAKPLVWNPASLDALSVQGPYIASKALEGY